MRDEFGSDEDNPYDGDFGTNSDGAENNLDVVIDSVIDSIGKVWNAPNSAVGLVVGGLGHLVGEVGQMIGLWDREPTITVANNAIQFLNNPIVQTATTFGNVTVYRGGEYYSPESITDDGNKLGYEEMQHTIQGQVLGPLYYPAHILFGVAGMLVTGQFNNWGWHSSTNILETGPHSENPNPWGCDK